MDTNVYWEFILTYFIFKTYKQWEDFEREVKYNNRYFPKSELLNEIKRIQKYAVCEINQGDVFYRARLFNLPWEYCKEEFEQVNQIIMNYYPDMCKEDSAFNINNSTDMLGFFTALSCAEKDNQQLLNEIDKVFRKDKEFWGYDAAQSDAPPNDKAPAGRANPKNISYLYIAEDIKTAMMEVRPNLTQHVNIATVRIRKKLRLFDFCYVDTTEDEKGKSWDLSIISSAFSAPNFGGEDNYYATQYLCEFIKELGFDGIRFYSSLNPSGKNIVLFNTNVDPLTKTKNYEITESKVYSVTKLDLDYQQEMPMID